MICKFVDSATNGSACCFESLNPVELADGTVDYVTMLFIHDNHISNITVNKEFNQGDTFYEKGTHGYATGNYVHMEIA